MAHYRIAIILAGILSITFISCQQSSHDPNRDEKASAPVSADTALTGYISSTASQVNQADTARKFIRTADLRFRVQDVAASTYSIEDAVRNQGGYVEQTNLACTKDRVEETRVSEDSVLEITYFTVNNSLTIRVPNHQLDSTLKLIAKEVEFLDSRQIQSDDVTWQLLANRQFGDIQKKSADRLTKAIDSRKARLDEVEDAEDNLQTRLTQAGEHALDNLRISDKVSMSTIRIELYQRESVQKLMLARFNPVQPYQPGFWSRIGESIRFGWDMIREILIFIVKTWGILLMLGLGYLGIRLLRRYRHFLHHRSMK